MTNAEHRCQHRIFLIDVRKIFSSLRQISVSKGYDRGLSEHQNYDTKSVLTKRQIYGKNGDSKRQEECSVCESNEHWWKENPLCKKVIGATRNLFKRSHSISRVSVARELEKTAGIKAGRQLSVKKLFRDWEH